ncbi:MAG: hypothetical protein Q8K86_08115 [Candidatus Nanopelagicaceae bacterium]|nr:hypothetical protein [Candidatus Nanopelagicaceae bacterium]
MTKVRLVVLHGKATDCHDKVECALRADKTSPAEDFWLSLRANAWPSGCAELVHPDAEAIDEYYKITEMLEHLVKTGTPQYEGASKYLKEGIWEVRHYRVRLPYFDVDENGENIPKAPHDDRRIVDPDGLDDDWWKYPHMDQTIRLTHGFIKSGDTAPEQYELAIQIRNEDLEHA